MYVLTFLLSATLGAGIGVQGAKGASGATGEKGAAESVPGKVPTFLPILCRTQ